MFGLFGVEVSQKNEICIPFNGIKAAMDVTDCVGVTVSGVYAYNNNQPPRSRAWRNSDFGTLALRAVVYAEFNVIACEKSAGRSTDQLYSSDDPQYLKR